jgi:manganese transport system ATP-binding protein
MHEVRMTPAIAGRDLVLAYGPKVAIDRSSFEIPKGGITALIGPNGSGKSTLLAAIAGLIEPVSGVIEVDSVGGRRQRISFVLQSTKINETLPVTVREVVAMGRYASGPLAGLGMTTWPRSRARCDAWVSPTWAIAT